jgi:hypothetical protein
LRIILATLLLPVAFASNGERSIDVTKVTERVAVRSSNAPGDSWEVVFQRLTDLAVSRQTSKNAPSWRAVEEALDMIRGDKPIGLVLNKSVGTFGRSGHYYGYYGSDDDKEK